MQSSHNTLGHLLLRKSLPDANFTILIATSHELHQGEYGSICFTWQSHCLHFFLKLPNVCSLDPSRIRLLGTPSLLKSRDSASCASDLACMGKALTHPQDALNSCAYLLFLLEITLDCIVSVYMSVLIRLYLRWRSFVLNLLDKAALATDLIPLWVVAFTVLLAASNPIPCCYAYDVTSTSYRITIHYTLWQRVIIIYPVSEEAIPPLPPLG